MPYSSNWIINFYQTTIFVESLAAISRQSNTQISAATSTSVSFLPNQVDCCIVLYEERLNSGHWVCLRICDGITYYFDPCAYAPDRPLEWITTRQRRMLDRDTTPHLSHLFARERYIYNKTKYQDPDDFVNTCGSHCCRRIYRLKQME